MPFGPQRNVEEDIVSRGGWRQCYRKGYENALSDSDVTNIETNKTFSVTIYFGDNMNFGKSKRKRERQDKKDNDLNVSLSLYLNNKERDKDKTFFSPSEMVFSINHTKRYGLLLFDQKDTMRNKIE